eukprot:5414599-Karenia_brevis.AAC.1
MAEKVMKGLLAGTPDQNAIQSFVDLWNVAAVAAGVQGVTIMAPSTTSGSTAPASSEDATGGGTKRELGPISPEQEAPTAKEFKTA